MACMDIKQWESWEFGKALGSFRYQVSCLELISAVISHTSTPHKGESLCPCKDLIGSGWGFQLAVPKGGINK